MALSLKSAKLEIYISESGTRPQTPQYTLSKTKLSNEDTINFEISELIKDYIDVNFDGNYSTASFNRFVETDLTRTFSYTVNGVERTTEDATPIARKFIAFRGYGQMEDINTYLNAPYYGENINPTLSKDVLISNKIIYHKKGEDLHIPFFTSTDGVNEVKFFDGATELSSKIFGGAVANVRADRDDIKADNFTGALQVYTADMTFLRTDDSSDTSKSTTGSGDTTKVTYTTPGGTDVEIEVREIEECKFTPYKITFINKFGALQDLWFFKKRTDQFSTEKENYYRTLLTTSSTGVDFNRFAHSKSLLDITTQETFRMNTGFVSEDHNEVIKQLMVTEYAWIHEKGLDSEEPIPITPITSSFTSKTELNDKLLNFEVEFDYANSYIQNVR
tara:strand:- start:7478 stop:8647 length:1170 start_codon:yes stop_codon:yes gene_type:complete